MKKFLIILALGIMLVSCDDSGSSSGSDYDRGYNDGYYGTSAKKTSGNYYEGYQDGEFDERCNYFKSNNLMDKYNAMRC
ncbi:hypothetical protein N9O29_02205 [Alphaproteobacteria bacterium]|nr:hypothetical protein [Alphaproteobacteria bacterium]MDB4234538.1 hypothetical protein [Alphaproteobacteria bacterium]